MILVLIIIQLEFCNHLFITTVFLRRALVGEMDEQKDSSMDLSGLRAAPLKPIIH